MRRNTAWVLMAALVPALVAGCQSETAAPTDPSLSVTFTPGSSFPCYATPGQQCIGFVGKGDVQLAFGLNNPQIQSEIVSYAPNYGNAFVFAFDAADTYEAVCSFTTGEGTPGEQTHEVTIPRHTAINSAINGDPRKGPGQWTGFNLLSLGATTTTGTVPVVGAACVGNPDGIAHNGTWSSVTLVSSSGGGLTVTRTKTGETKPLS